MAIVAFLCSNCPAAIRNAHFCSSLAPLNPCLSTRFGYFTRPGSLWTSPVPPSLNSTTSISTLRPETERKYAVGIPSNVIATWSAERRTSSLRAGAPDAAVPKTIVMTMNDARTSLFTPSSPLRGPTAWRRRLEPGSPRRGVLRRERADESAGDARVRDELFPDALERGRVGPVFAAAAREEHERACAKRRRGDDDAVRTATRAFRMWRGAVGGDVFVDVVGRHTEQRGPVGEQDRHDVVRRHGVVRDAAATDVKDVIQAQRDAPLRREGVGAGQDPGGHGQFGGGLLADEHACSVACRGTRMPASSS